MPLSKETKDRIAKEAKAIIGDYNTLAARTAKSAYIAGAEAEAERAQGLVDCLKEIRKYFPDTTNNARIIDNALTKYNQPK